MSWGLNTRMLRMLVAIAENGSAAKAAAALNVTPSALSHQIRQAEDTLRVKLFDRINGRLQPTPVTEDLLVSARIVTAEMDQAERSLERRRNGLRPSIRVSAGAYPIHRWLIPLIQSGDRQDPPEVNLVVARTVPLARAVVEGELDLAIVAGEQRERGVTAIPLFCDELVAILPPDHHLRSADFLDAAQLSREVYISYSRWIEDGLEDDRLFRPARQAPARFIEACSVEAILQWVQAGAGFSILSRWAVAADIAAGRVACGRLTPGGLPLPWWAVIRATDANGGVSALFARHIAEELGSKPPP